MGENCKSEENLMKGIKLLILLILVGCADGPKFRREKLTEDGAVVYFYRPSFVGVALPPHEIKEASTNENVATLLPGGYYPYITKPGAKTFTWYCRDETAKVSLNIEANQEYFIKSTYDIWTLQFRLLASPILINVPKEEALEEIEDKRLNIVKD